jgi:3-deoxy-D-manno-octulosonate 8-phosphate phosphatase KdsC-like HAD superfamily phosphatase
MVLTIESKCGTINDYDSSITNGDTILWIQENGIEFARFLGLDGATVAMALEVSTRKAFTGSKFTTF